MGGISYALEIHQSLFKKYIRVLRSAQLIYTEYIPENELPLTVISFLNKCVCLNRYCLIARVYCVF